MSDEEVPLTSAETNRLLIQDLLATRFNLREWKHKALEKILECDTLERRVLLLEGDIEFTVTAWQNSEHGNFEKGMVRLQHRLEEI